MVNIMDLSEGVLVEILLRLPVKSLLKFKCVCKTWCDLIKSNYFLDLHLNLPELRDVYIFIQRHKYFDDGDGGKSIISLHSNDESLPVVNPNIRDFSDVFSKNIVWFPTSCNGVLCLTDGVAIGLYNPAIREFTLLPPRPFPSRPRYPWNTKGLAFGYDPVVDDYKVVRFISFDPDEWNDQDFDFDLSTIKVEIYNLSSDSWRQLDDISILYPSCFGAVSFNGYFHWTAIIGVDLSSGCKILCFHIGDEVFQEMEFPEDLNRSHPLLLILDESLAFVSQERQIPGDYEGDSFFDVWVMKDYGVEESWIKNYRIGPVLDIERPIWSWKNDFLFLQSGDGRLVSCGVVLQQQRKYDTIKGHPHLHLGVVNFKESLVSIRKILEKNLVRRVSTN